MKEFLISVAQAEAAIRAGESILQLYTKDRSSVYFMKKNDLVNHELFNKLKGFELYLTEHNEYIKTLMARGTFSLEKYTKKIHPQIIIKETADEAFVTAANWTYQYDFSNFDEVQDAEDEEDKKVPKIKKSKKKRKGFGVEFFPVGTFFTRSHILLAFKVEDISPEVYCVKDVVRNGIDSYVIRSTVPSKLAWLSEENESFNISWAERILERGEKLCIINSIDTFFRSDYCANQNALLKQLFPLHAKKGYWLCQDPEAVVQKLLRSICASEHVVFDSIVMRHHLVRQSFVKRLEVSSWYGSNFYQVNKKRAKRYIQQNQNRFLSSAWRAQAEFDEVRNRVDDFYEDMFDEPLTNEYTKSEAKQPGDEDNQCL